jgi:tetratricopeptide (TPR) repeat protein
MKARRKTGFWAGLLDRFVGGVRRIFTSRGDEEKRLPGFLDKLADKPLPIFDLEAAEGEAKRIRREFPRLLEQPQDTPEEQELALVTAILDLGSRHNTGVSEPERIASRARETIERESDPQIKRRLLTRQAQLDFCLARRHLDRGDKIRSKESAYNALSAGALKMDERREMINILLQCDALEERAFHFYLEHLSHCRSDWDEKLSGGVIAKLRQMSGFTEASSLDDRELALQRKRRIHLAAPWLDWPLVELAEIDLQSKRIEPAGRKLESVYPPADEGLSSHTAFLLGQVAYYQEKYDRADYYFDEALRSGADVASIYEFMGVAKANIGAFDPAMVYIDKALAVSPEDSYLLLQKANVLLCQERLGEAQTYYDQTLSREPDHADALFGLAKIEEISGRLDEAFILYDQILSQTVEHAPAKFSLGLILLKRGNVEEAKELFEQVHKHDSSHLPTRLELGILLIREVIESPPHRLGAGSDRRLDAGVEHLRRCEQAKYPDPRIGYWLGRALAEKGSYDEALSRWEPLLTSGYDSRLAYQIEAVRFLKALDLNRAGDTDGALNLLENLPREAQTSLPVDDIVCLFNLNLARDALLDGRHERAAALLEQARAIRPDNARANFLLVMNKLGQGDLAKEELRAIINRLADGVEKELCRLLDWLHERRFDLALEPGDELWARVSRSGVPLRVADDPALQLSDLLSRIVSRRKNGQPVEEADVERLIELGSRLEDGEFFSSDDLGWWMAWLILTSEARGRLAEQLRAVWDQRSNSAVTLALGLILLNFKRHEEGVEMVRLGMREENPRLADYVARIFGQVAHKEIIRIGKEPQRIRRAHELLRQTATLTDLTNLTGQAREAA